MKLIEFFGPSNSGKTTVISEIVKMLKKDGHSVATIKSTKNELNYEKDSKDSLRYLKAGADLSVALGKRESVIHYSKRLPILKILPMLNVEYVLVEGETGFPMPKILFFNEHEGIERVDALTIAMVGSKKLEASSVASRFINVENVEAIYKLVLKNAMPPLPGDDCGHCGMDCTQMMEKIIKGEKTYKNCVKLVNKGVSLEINSQTLSMLPFISSIIKDVNSGILKNLKGVNSGHVKLEFDFER